MNKNSTNVRFLHHFPTPPPLSPPLLIGRHPSIGEWGSGIISTWQYVTNVVQNLWVSRLGGVHSNAASLDSNLSGESVQETDLESTVESINRLSMEETAHQTILVDCVTISVSIVALWRTYSMLMLNLYGLAVDINGALRSVVNIITSLTTCYVIGGVHPSRRTS